MRHHTTASALALTIALGSAPALADNSDPTVLEPVIITASAEGARAVGGSVTFLDQEALAIFGHADVNQVLRQVPGVFLQEEDGFGLRPNIGIRGSGTDRSGRVAVMEDGVLIAPAPYAAPAAYYFPRLTRMTGVEVTKGPGAIKYGPLTTGGAINLFSTPIPDTAGGELEILGGTDGALRAHGWAGGWAPLGGGLEIGGLIEGLREESDGFKVLDNGGPTGFGIDDLVFKLAVRTGPGAALPQSLELKHQTYEETSHETYLGLTLADFGADPYRRYNGSQVDRMDVAHDTWQLTHRLALSDALDLTTIAYRTETTRAWYKLNDVRNSAGTGWVGIGAVLADPAAYADQMAVLAGADGFTSADGALRVRNNNRAYAAEGIQTVLTARFDTGALSHQLEVSARYHQDSEDRFQRNDLYRMDDGVMILTGPGVDGTQDNRVGEAEAWAFFVRDVIRAGALTLTPGVRYETIDLTRTNYALAGGPRGAPLSVIESSVDVWIPGVGLTYDLTPSLRLVAGAHRGFSNPGPGSSVDPETSWNYEAGVRHRSGGLDLEVIAYVNDYDNLLGTCTASTGGNCVIGDQFAGGAFVARGVEATAAYDLGPAVGAGFGLPVSLVYTFTDTEFRTSFSSSYEPWGDVQAGDEAPYLPAHQLTLNAGVRFDRWRADVRLNRVSEARAVAGSGSIAAEDRIDARTLVDVAGSFDLTDNVALFASVQNLTDEVYNVAFSPAGARPGAPRLAMGGLRLRF